jgi:hypothetical protein
MRAHEARGHAMSNIPFTAIGAALTPVQQSTNEQLRARRVQSAKDSHHTEDVEELDETAVNSVKDQQQNRGGRQEKDEEKRQDREEEKVEIAALKEVPAKATGKGGRSRAAGRQLDISA